MRFSATEEQQLVQASALDWLGGNYDFRSREAGVHRDGGSPAAWNAFAELGWLGLPLPEDVGGSGAGLAEAGLLMQAFGRHLVVEPYHACVLQGARLLALAGDARQKAEWLPGLVEGRIRLALAHAEPGDALSWSPRRCVARPVAEGWCLEGRKQLVIGGPSANAWLVSAREPGPDGRDVLLLVGPAQSGVVLDPYDTSDGGRATDAHFDGVPLGPQALVGTPGESTAALLRQVLAEGLVTRCWEATGAMQAVLEQATQHTAQRRQFGQALSAFQVVQHRLAEMAVQCTEAQAACELATMRLAQDPAAAREIAAMVMGKVGRAARYVAQEAVQLHGAMGVCEELPVAATFRMLLAFAQRNGDPAAHAELLGSALLASGRHAFSQTLGEPA